MLSNMKIENIRQFQFENHFFLPRVEIQRNKKNKNAKCFFEKFPPYYGLHGESLKSLFKKKYFSLYTTDDVASSLRLLREVAAYCTIIGHTTEKNNTNMHTIHGRIRLL